MPANTLSSVSAGSAIADPIALAEPREIDVLSTATNDMAPPLASTSHRRLFLKVAAGLMGLAAVLAAAGWLSYQSEHVVSRNALVRSHLSELGIRGEGVVAEIYVKAGDSVQAGQLLAKLDDRHLLAQRQEIEARLETLAQQIAVGEAALEFAKEKARVTRLGAQSEYERRRAEAKAAEVQAEDSRAFHAARQALGSGGAVAAETIRDAAAKAAMQASLATAANAAAESSYSELQAARLAEEEVVIREGELGVVRAQREEAAAELARVNADIMSTRVIAPADGAIIRRLAQPGMAVSTGVPLLSLWLTDETWIEAWIPEERLSDLQTGRQVRVSFPALPGQYFRGHLERIGLATDFEMPMDYLPQTREMRMRPTPQIGVQIRLEETPEAFRPGMSAVVDISRGEV